MSRFQRPCHLFSVPANINVVAPSQSPGDPSETIEMGGGGTVAEGSPLDINFTANGDYACGVGFESVGSQYTIDWGDSSTSAAGGTQPSDSEFDGTGSHTYTHSGQYLVTVTDDSDEAWSSMFVDITNPGPTLAPIPDQTVEDGSSVTFSTAISGAEAGDYSQAWINWGDGEGEQPATISGNTITAVSPNIFTPTTATLLFADGTTVPVSQPANVAVTPPVITSMTATDASNSSNAVTVTGGVAGDIYVQEATSGPNAGSASVVFAMSHTGAKAAILYAPRPSYGKAVWSPGATILTVTPPPGAPAPRAGTPDQWDYTVDATVNGTPVQTITIHVFKLEITASDGLTALSPTNPTAMVVGQLVTLKYKPEGDAPPVAPSGTPYSWTIPGTDQEPLPYPTAVENFTLSGAAAVPLSSADLSAQTVSFYWIAPTTSAQSVALSINMGTASGIHSYTASAQFDVVAPASTFSASALGPSGLTLAKGADGLWALSFGKNTGPHGIDLSGRLSVPQAGDGWKLGKGAQLAIVQVGETSSFAADPAGQPLKPTAPPLQYLNDGKPGSNIPFIDPPTDLMAPLYAGLPSVPHMSNDSPDQALGTADVHLRSLTEDYQFVDYLMFRPSTDGIWVTLDTLQWYIKTSVHWDAATSQFVFDSDPNAPANLLRDASNGPIASATTSALPEWSGGLAGLSTDGQFKPV